VSDAGPATPPRRKRRILGLDDQQRQAQRRTLLLDAALELFGTRGYAKTSIELLCQTAGIGTNSFYDLFASKEAVLIGLYDHLSVRLPRASPTISTKPNGPARALGAMLSPSSGPSPRPLLTGSSIPTPTPSTASSTTSPTTANE
jgi:AcrR family transcriptional regulator